MRALEDDGSKTVIEMTNSERELIDCMFSMINSADNPNWGATEDGYGNIRLDESKFDKLCDDWRTAIRTKVNKPRLHAVSNS